MLCICFCCCWYSATILPKPCVSWTRKAAIYLRIYLLKTTHVVWTSCRISFSVHNFPLDSLLCLAITYHRISQITCARLASLYRARCANSKSVYWLPDSNVLFLTFVLFCCYSHWSSPSSADFWEIKQSSHDWFGSQQSRPPPVTFVSDYDQCWFIWSNQRLEEFEKHCSMIWFWKLIILINYWQWILNNYLISFTVEIELFNLKWVHKECIIHVQIVFAIIMLLFTWTYLVIFHLNDFSCWCTANSSRKVISKKQWEIDL